MLLSILFSLYLLLAAASHAIVGDVAAAVESQPAQLERKDRLHGIENDRHRADAILHNARDSHRIGSSRPQRLLPVYGSKPGRGQAKFLNNPKFNPLKAKLLPCNEATVLLPLHGSASCRYYVFALRRILC